LYYGLGNPNDMSIIRRFIRDEAGGVAIAFGLSLTAILACSGVAMDYSRASNARTTLQSALDSAVLQAGKSVLATGHKVTVGEIRKSLRTYLSADDAALVKTVEVVQTSTKLEARASSSVKSFFGTFTGQERIPVMAQASIPVGSTRLEIALVLDTTGSMAALGKMDALKVAANELIDTVTAAKTAGSEVAFAVVPFTSQVRLPVSNANANWMDFRTGQTNPAENASKTGWNGCVMDRDKPHNTKKDTPTPGKQEEAYPAVQTCKWPNLQPISGLDTNIASVKGRINALIPDGNTNTTIGLAWGNNVLTPGSPMGDGSSTVAGRAIRMMVFLTDGLNTEDRFAQTPAQMDADMRELCRNSKSGNIRIFTIRVIEGNESLLQDCASNPGDYYRVDNTAGMLNAFREIASKMTKLRLSS
jgi:Flp pilus assembly protein TadG